MLRLSLLSTLCLACASPQPAAAAPHAPTPSLRDVSQSIVAISEKARLAVVQIHVTGLADVAPVAASTSGLLAEQRGAGSGVVVDGDGYVVTNAHVVKNATDIRVVINEPDADGGPHSILWHKTRTLEAKVVGIDSETDLALLKLDTRGLVPLPFGDSDELRRGEIVLAFGSPRGLEDSVSMGVVASRARQVVPDHPVVHIQTDASINPGNSGGPLINTKGEVIGINTFIVSNGGGSEGLGFAVPSNIVRVIVDQLRQTGKVRRGVIGVEAQTIDSELAEALSLPVQSGVLLADVLPGSPAMEAGLAVGDIATSINGKPLENGRQFDVNVYQRSVGDTVAVGILRGKQEVVVKVAVAERVDGAGSLTDLVNRKTNLVKELGILGLDVDRRTAQRLRLRRVGGVLVGAVAARGPAMRGRLRPGDVLHTLNRKPIESLSELRAVLGALEPGAAVAVHVERKGLMRFMSFRTESE